MISSRYKCLSTFVNSHKQNPHFMPTHVWEPAICTEFNSPARSAKHTVECALKKLYTFFSLLPSYILRPFFSDLFTDLLFVYFISFGNQTTVSGDSSEAEAQH